MPVVPRPQTMSVMPSVTSGGGFGNPLSLDAATLPGRQISHLGEAIQSGAHVAEVFARSEKDKAEATVALDGSNRLQQKRFDLADPDKVFPGVNDWSKTEQALAEFDKGWADISATMSPGARGMLDQSAMVTRSDLVRDLARNDADRARKFHADVLATTVNQATGVLMAGTGGNDASYAARARAALTADGLGRGLSGEDLDRYAASAFGRRVVEPVVTARLSQGDVIGARAFFDAHRNGMAADDAERLDTHLVDAGQAWDAKTAVDDLWMRLGPKSLNDPIDIEAMENDLVVRHGGNAQALMRERDEVLHRILGFIQARDETHAGYVNLAIARIKDGASPSQVASLPQFLALPLDQQQQLIDWQRGRVMKSLTGFAPDQNLERMAQQFAAYHDLSAGDALKQMSEARIQALEPVLGDDLTKHVLAKKQAAESRQPPRLGDTTFRGIATGLGIDPNPGPFDVEGKARLGVLRSRAEAAIDAAEAGGKVLTPEERRQVAMSEGASLVRDHPFFALPQDVQDVLETKPMDASGATGGMPTDVARAVKEAKVRGEQVWKVQMAPTLVVPGAGKNAGRGVMVPSAGQAPEAWLVTPKGQRTTWDTETDGDKIRLTLVDRDTRKRSDPVVIDTPAYGETKVLDFGPMGRLIMVSPSDPGVAQKFFEGIGNGAVRGFSAQAAHDVNLYDEVTHHPWETAGNVLGAVPGIVGNGLYRLTPQGQVQTAIDGFNSARDFFGRAKDAYDHQRLGTFAGETIGGGIPGAVDALATGGLGFDGVLIKGATESASRNFLKRGGRATLLTERGLGGAEGHGRAGSVSPGGSGRAFAGHGVMNGMDRLEGKAHFVAPEGTTVVMPRPGIKIADSTGKLLEKFHSVEDLEAAIRTGIDPEGRMLTPRNLHDLHGYEVIKPGQTGPNLTLLHPGFDRNPINIMEKSTTTLEPARLSELLEPNMGCTFWAACTQPVTHIPEEK